jgi:signal transduction histidine kinase
MIGELPLRPGLPRPRRKDEGEGGAALEAPQARPRMVKAAAIVCLPALVTLGVDLATPEELDLSILYAVSIVACGWLRAPRLVLATTAMSLVLALADLHFGGPAIHTDTYWLHVANRAMAAFGLLTLGSIVWLWVRGSRMLETSRRLLARQLDIQREFIADAAHELRTPLGVLRARIDTMGNETAAVPLRNDVDAMARTVNQLLDVAEVETLEVRDDERADLLEVCAATVAHLAPLALARGKSVALVGAERPVWVRGNAEALMQAVRNLLENAVAHTAPGTTATINLDPSGVIRVSDRGPGVAPEHRELVFRRFWRRDRRRTGSAGLGLAIVARVVKAHGGSIAVGDGFGGGAMFSLSLAHALAPTPDAAPARGAAAALPGELVA